MLLNKVAGPAAAVLPSTVLLPSTLCSPAAQFKLLLVKIPFLFFCLSLSVTFLYLFFKRFLIRFSTMFLIFLFSLLSLAICSFNMAFVSSAGIVFSGSFSKYLRVYIFYDFLSLKVLLFCHS